jgi:hypothetical protein
MKKSLIALAVLAASGGAFAQAQTVSITGTLGMGFKSTTTGNAAGTVTSGMGVDQSEINFGIAQKIDGAQTVEVKLGIAGADRSGESSATGGDLNSGSVYGRDASITYTNTNFGQFKLATSEGGDYFNAVAGLGVSGQGQPLVEMDGKLHETKSSSDKISYTVPLGPVYFNVEHAEHSSRLGFGKGSTGSGSGQRNNTYSLYYAAGPLQLLGAYRTYDNGLSGPCTASSCPALSATKDNLYNLQGAYDFGVVKVGVGYQYVNASAGMHQSDAQVTVAVPMGPLTLAAAFDTSKLADAVNTNAFANIGGGGAWIGQDYEGTTNGYSLGAKYNLSKNFSVLTKFASWTHSGYSRYEADAPFKAAALQAFSGPATAYAIAGATYQAAAAAYAANPSAATGAAAQAAGAAAQAAGATAQAAWLNAKNASSGLTGNNTASEASIVLTYTF